MALRNVPPSAYSKWSTPCLPPKNNTWTPDTLTCDEYKHFVLSVEYADEMENVGMIKGF